MCGLALCRLHAVGHNCMGLYARQCAAGRYFGNRLGGRSRWRCAGIAIETCEQGSHPLCFQHITLACVGDLHAGDGRGNLPVVCTSYDTFGPELGNWFMNDEIVDLTVQVPKATDTMVSQRVMGGRIYDSVDRPHMTKIEDDPMSLQQFRPVMLNATLTYTHGAYNVIIELVRGNLASYFKGSRY